MIPCTVTLDINISAVIDHINRIISSRCGRQTVIKRGVQYRKRDQRCNQMMKHRV